MNLYFRMVIVFFKIWLGHKKSWEEESILSFRVYPFDCDINFHLTSARYVGFADLGRIHLMGQMGVFQSFFKRRWFPFASGIEITYIRPIKPFQKLKVRSKVTSWDEKYIYVEHCFEADNKVMAIAIVRGVFVKDRNIVPMNDIVSLGGADPFSPPPSKTMDQWKELLKVKKEEYSSETTNKDS
jgi:acyl-CoA thioesterase FadM